MRTRFFSGFILFTLLLFLPSAVIASGRIARGVVPGEIYVYGVGGTFPELVNWLYRSTDSGQTIYPQNDTVNVGFLGEGVVLGELYKTWYGNLSYSANFGVDFVFKNIISDLEAIASGYVSGEVYAYVYPSTKYSTDYGETFVDTGPCPGWVICMSVGHSLGEVYCGCHDGEVYYSSNYGETYDLVVDLAYSVHFKSISRGSEAGEIYLLDNNRKIYFSPNHGDTLYQQHSFESDDIARIAGGFFPGEVYAVESVHYLLGGGDLYIHRSTDYGQTFTINHVYSTQEDVLPPESVTALETSLADSSIVLTWSAINQDIWENPETVDYYVVYRDTGPDFVPASEDSIAAPVGPTYTDLEFSSSIPYFYVVKAVDESGNKSDDSNRVGRFNRDLVNVE